VSGSYLYGVVETLATGSELWVSNGTQAGTALLEINPVEGGGANPTRLTDVDGTLFFIANDGNTGDELWKTRGTAGTTSPRR
jgi:ELWxxDGT repeat protein